MSNTCLNSTCANYTSGPIGQLFTSSIQFLFAAQCMINEKWPPDASSYIQDLTFDYIVVGGGSAGSVIASRLSEDSCRRVLLVEAGGDPPLESLVPSAAANLYTPEHAWVYKSENDSRICQLSPDGRCNIFGGKMLGGGSSINGMFYFRGNREDYNELERAGNTGWNSDTALKYFKKSENLSVEIIRKNDRLSIYHNYEGLLGVGRSVIESSVSDAIIKGYSEVGYQYNIDPNGRYQMGAHHVFQTVQDGVRESTARAFLVPANERPNLFVLKHALVKKILTENKRATGVSIELQNGTVIEATALKEVITSAGAIRSPHLLMLSGIGPRDHLSSFNIPVIADLPVGKNLLDHPCVLLQVNIQEALPARDVIMDAVNYLAFRRGFFSELPAPPNTGGRTGALITTNNTIYDSDLPNFQILQYVGDRVIQFLLVYLDSPSRGDIKLSSNDPSQYPRIDLNYYDDAIDIENWMQAFNFIMRLINTPSLQSVNATYVPDPACGSFENANEDYWKCILYRNSFPGHHFRGTVKMGPLTDKEAVVNPQLRVNGIEHLRVVDASVIPGVIRGPTNAATIMFAERASDLIKEVHKRDVC